MVAFQVLENQLWQLGSLALDPGHVGHGRRTLADLTFFKLCQAAEAAVLAALDAQSREATQFRSRLRVIMDRCDELRIARNLLIHSTYVFVEAGGELVGIMRSDVSAAADNHEVEFDQEWLDADSFEDAIERAALLAFEVSQCRIQLIHWIWRASADIRAAPPSGSHGTEEADDRNYRDAAPEI